jgi:hypothetical protein
MGKFCPFYVEFLIASLSVIHIVVQVSLLTFNPRPASVQPKEDSKKLENGHSIPEVDESGNRKGETIYVKYYQKFEQLVGQVSCIHEVL